MTAKIDSHVHFWQIARGDYHWLSKDMLVLQRDFNQEDFDTLRTRHQVSRIVLVQAAPTHAETRYIMDLAHECEYVAGVIGKVDIEKGDTAIQQLSELAGQSIFRGIRPMFENMAENSWMDLPALDPVIQEITDLDLTFECMVLPHELEALTAWLNRHPKLKAVLSHAGMPNIRDNEFESWSRWIKRIASDTQVYCKLSGMTTLAAADWTVEDLRPYVEHLLYCFGHERLIWGSDWPVMLLAGDYHGWCKACDTLLAELDESMKQAIYFDNAKQFYRLS